MLAFSPIRTFSCGGAFLLHLLPATEKYRPLSQAKIITNGDCGARPFVVILQHKNHTVMKKIFLLLALTVNSQWSMVLGNDFTVPDSSKIVDVEEVVVIATPKEQGKLKEQPSSVSIISQQDMLRHHITSVKGISSVVPNLFIPDYGSRLTTAIYIRGIGSRLNTPAAGLYVDNIPYYNMSAFDFNLYDIERIDVLRGPQGTLYGRNSMGGLLRVNTRSPFTYQGTDLKLSMATGDWHRRASLTHYHRISDRFAFSAGGYYEGSSGFWHNATRHERQDKMNSGGGRLRFVGKPSDRLTLDGSIGYDYTHEGGYPYLLIKDEDLDLNNSEVLSNEKTSYRRGMLNAGLNVQWKGKGFTLNAVTGLQHMQDRMFLDQDFIADSIYTLEQKQRLTLLSEEITLKSTVSKLWSTVSGLSTAKQWLRTTGPVTFQTGGIDMLERNINGFMPDLSARGISSMGVDITDNNFITGGTFQTPLWNLAVFHQSTFNFTDRLSAMLGVRLDYEHNSLTYNAPALLNYDFTMQSGRMPLALNGLQAAPLYDGKIKKDYFEVLPKTSIKYILTPQVFIYASAAKGLRPGGYNVQMFSDLLQGTMRNEMMQGIKDGANATLDRYAQMGMPERVIQMIQAGLDQMPVGGEMADVQDVVTYKPEYSWTYELGAKFKHTVFSFEGSVFLTTVRDQQIARFSENGFGRMMVNAGRSRNWGTELSLGYNPNDRLSTWLNYGFTRATFTKYDDGSGTDYTGKYVPFIPRHTLSLGADYTLPFASSKLKALTLGLNTLGAGRIYWTEANDASQALYFTFGAHALLDFGRCEINLWGRNLADKHYNAFYFESMNRAFVQKGKPLQVGVDLNVKS